LVLNLITLVAVFLFEFLSLDCLAESKQTHTTNSISGAETWQTHTSGVTFSLTQILPDQARAFYVNRGFTLAQAESYATSCIYMTILRNDKAPGVVHFELQNWSIGVNGKTSPPINVENWLDRLKKEGVKKSALIAFRWAQFPPEHEYQPGGDWNQGMMTTGLPAGSQFDVIARWDINGRPYEGVLKNVRCTQ